MIFVADDTGVNVTLDPVHLDGIADLAARIRHDVDEAEHRELAHEVWTDFLDPLYVDGEAMLEPLDERARYRAPAPDLGLQSPAFDTVHGLDSGTINPRTFRNGLVLDVAQAAMSATPSDLDLHRSRTIIKSVHSNDATVNAASDWRQFDEGYGRGRIVQVADLARDQERVVHGLSLYLAESEHALGHAEAVDELLVLDGPIYPKQILTWAERHRGLADVLTDHDLVAEVVENYLALVERFVERDVPLVGFVKSATSRALVRALRDRTTTPWASDLALFSQLLERHGDGRRLRDELTWTGWFVSRLGADGTFSGQDTDLGVERALDPEAYEIAFFVVYDPRVDLAFKVELPMAFARDGEVRERVRQQVLRDVACEQGPPSAIAKADELARIGRAETRSLVEKLEETFESREDRTYDDERWGAS